MLALMLLVTGMQVTDFTVNAKTEGDETEIITCAAEDEEEKAETSESEESAAKEKETEVSEEKSEEETTIEEKTTEEEEATEEETTQEEETTEEETMIAAMAVEETDMAIEQISSVKYEVTVENSESFTSFEWKAQGASWQEKTKNVELNGDGDYSFDLAFDNEDGLKNLGYIMPVVDSEMTVTIHKVIVNGYELEYETEPVLKAGADNENGLSNIWNVKPGVRICGNDNAYLALDKQDGAITLYAKDEKEETAKKDGASLDYVKAMGSGWNLGNSFDGFDADLDTEDTGELAWGNPTVTRELLAAVKEKGYDSIRIPFTIHRRYTVNENAGENEYKYVIKEEWLARYKEVVNWAVDEGFYVMINIHHDSWIWLKYWDGDKASEEYRMYTDFWKQLAEYMADLPEQVCFETINEPDFEENAQQKLDEINQAAYDIIRGTKGNEERMIVIPSIYTNFEKCVPLYHFIEKLDDENVIATVHYYSEWVYSANLGKTSFDEELWKNDGESYTPRDAADNLMNTLQKQFISNGIGVIVGEYGLLGYDASEGCLQTGEELKYYEYMNELARQNNVCLVFWDNGSGINRTNGSYTWKKPTVGEMLESSMTGRSSYATGLNTLYFKEEVKNDVEIPLTLNGNIFKGIKGLTKGTDYTYDNAGTAVILKKEYINSMLAKKTGYGIFTELVFEFSSGADWHEYLVKYDTPVIKEAQGTKEGIQIPVSFHGCEVRRVTAYQASGKVGPNSDWWDYLQYDGSFGVDYEKETINLLSDFFADATVKDGLMKLKVEFYDGQIEDIWLRVDGNKVTSNPNLEIEEDAINASTMICLYTGETAIPSQYLEMPEGGSVYGTWVDETANHGMVTLEGWPCKMIFDTKAHDNFVSGGIVLYYMDVEKYADVTFGIKDMPIVEDIEIKASAGGKLVIKNIAEDAQISYKSNDTSVAVVSKDGTVTGKKAGNTVITVTVKQYNRSDDFEAVVTVKTGEASQGHNGNNTSANQSQSSGSSSSVKKQESGEQSTKANNVTSENAIVQEITEQSVALAQQPVMEQSVTAEKSQTTKKSVSQKTQVLESDKEVEETSVESITQVVTEETTEELQEQEMTAVIEEETATVEDEATPLAAEQQQDKLSPLPFIIAGIMAVILVAGVAVIYFKKKESIEE